MSMMMIKTIRKKTKDMMILQCNIYEYDQFNNKELVMLYSNVLVKKQ